MLGSLPALEGMLSLSAEASGTSTGPPQRARSQVPLLQLGVRGCQPHTPSSLGVADSGLYSFACEQAGVRALCACLFP